MLIWRGWGIVVAGVIVAAFFVGGMIAAILRLGRNESLILATLMLLPAGILTWYLGKRMNRDMDRELVDPRTGQTVIVRNDHSLFFVRVEYWGPIMAIGGVLLALILIISPPAPR